MRKPVRYQPGGTRSARDAGQPHKLYSDDNDHLWYTLLDPEIATGWLLDGVSKSSARMIGDFELTRLVSSELVRQASCRTMEVPIVHIAWRAAEPFGLLRSQHFRLLIGSAGWLGIRLVSRNGKPHSVLVHGETADGRVLRSDIGRCIAQLPSSIRGRQPLLSSARMSIEASLDTMTGAVIEAGSDRGFAASPTAFLRWKLSR